MPSIFRRQRRSLYEPKETNYVLFVIIFFSKIQQIKTT